MDYALLRVWTQTRNSILRSLEILESKATIANQSSRDYRINRLSHCTLPQREKLKQNPPLLRRCWRHGHQRVPRASHPTPQSRQRQKLQEHSSHHRTPRFRIGCTSAYTQNSSSRLQSARPGWRFRCGWRYRGCAIWPGCPIGRSRYSPSVELPSCRVS